MTGNVSKKLAVNAQNGKDGVGIARWYTENDSLFLVLTDNRTIRIGNLKGPGATVKIGRVETVNFLEGASIENVGTDTDVILNIKIPAGRDGNITEEYIDMYQSVSVSAVEAQRSADRASDAADRAETAAANIDESNLVHKTGDEKIKGNKTFDGTVQVNGELQLIGSDDFHLYNRSIVFDSHGAISPTDDGLELNAEGGSVSVNGSLVADSVYVGDKEVTTKETVANGYKYYGEASVVPSSQDLFKFEINKTDKTAKIVGNYSEFDGYLPANLSGDIVIPFEYKITEGSNAGVYKVTEIGEYSLHYSNITSIRIPNTVTTIGAYALQHCTKLGIINFPDSVHTLGEGVCAYCSGLTWAIFEGSISTIPKNAFRNCCIFGVTLPKYVRTVGECAFCENYGLNNITIPDSLQAVGYNAFDSCWDVRDTWYEGNEEQWNQITFETGNDGIIYPVHYGCVPATEGFVNEKIKSLSAPLKASVDIPGGIENWTAENVYDANNKVIGVRYGKRVNVNNATITPYSKVDLQLTSEQTAILYGKGLAFVAENDNGVVTVYCIGNIPEDNYTFQVVVTEVVVNA